MEMGPLFIQQNHYHGCWSLGDAMDKGIDSYGINRVLTHCSEVIMKTMASQNTSNCLLNCLLRCWSKKTSKLHVTGLCAGNTLVTGEFPAQKVSKMEKVSI